MFLHFFNENNTYSDYPWPQKIYGPQRSKMVLHSSVSVILPYASFIE